jgi:hypothetical protein
MFRSMATVDNVVKNTVTMKRANSLLSALQNKSLPPSKIISITDENPVRGPPAVFDDTISRPSNDNDSVPDTVVTVTFSKRLVYDSASMKSIGKMLENDGELSSPPNNEFGQHYTK